jgi:hypothetical protein
LGAMLVVACVVVVLGVWLPGPIFGLIQESAHLLEGSL